MRPRDPLWRRAFSMALAAGVAVALAGLAGVGWALAAAAAAAALVATDLVARLAPLRARVLELSGAPPGERPDLGGIAARLEDARERLEREGRRAELERDDLFGVLEAAGEGILVLGADQRVELLNDAARRLLDPPVEPLGAAMHEVTRDPELAEFVDALRRGEAPPPRRIDLARPGGATSVLVSGAHVRGARSRRRAVLVLHDLTALRRLERVRTDFVANVTHEMRSPLTSILGYAETLATDDAEPEGRRDYLERIQRNARRLDDIVRDLIELSRLEHAPAPAATPTDPRELVVRVAEAFRDGAARKRIALEVEVERLPPRVALDAKLVRQALGNLVDNAVKYTPEGGRVRVEGRMLDADRLEVAVSDTGPGIPPEHQGRIFERFYRVDTARSRALGGTGLGLSIVKHAAALHGGRVRLESEVGRGSTFRVELPVRGTGA